MTKKNWKMLRKENLPQTIFYAITIISAGLVVPPLWNYTRFYIALNNFDYSLSNATIYTSQIKVPNSAQAQINITLIATNPIDYSGLRTGTIGCALMYLGDSHTIYVAPDSPLRYLASQTIYLSSGRTAGYLIVTNWWLLATPNVPQQSGPIGPNSKRTISIEISITLDYGNTDYRQNVDFINHLRTMPNEIEWTLNCHLPLIAFLGTFDVPRTFQVTTPLNQSST